jgi:hypothetical protein
MPNSITATLRRNPIPAWVRSSSNNRNRPERFLMYALEVLQLLLERAYLPKNRRQTSGNALLVICEIVVQHHTADSFFRRPQVLQHRTDAQRAFLGLPRHVFGAEQRENFFRPLPGCHLLL